MPFFLTLIPFPTGETAVSPNETCSFNPWNSQFLQTWITNSPNVENGLSKRGE